MDKFVCHELICCHTALVHSGADFFVSAEFYEDEFKGWVEAQDFLPGYTYTFADTHIKRDFRYDKYMEDRFILTDMRYINTDLYVSWDVVLESGFRLLDHVVFDADDYFQPPKDWHGHVIRPYQPHKKSAQQKTIRKYGIVYAERFGEQVAKWPLRG